MNSIIMNASYFEDHDLFFTCSCAARVRLAAVRGLGVNAEVREVSCRNEKDDECIN